MHTNNITVYGRVVKQLSQSGASCIQIGCLFQWDITIKFDSVCWSSTKQTASSSKQKITSSAHEVAETNNKHGEKVLYLPVLLLSLILCGMVCFMYSVLYSFNIILSWSAIMLLDSVLINFIWNCIYIWMRLLLCMSMYAWAYVLCF